MENFPFQNTLDIKYIRVLCLQTVHCFKVSQLHHFYLPKEIELIVYRNKCLAAQKKLSFVKANIDFTIFFNSKKSLRGKYPSYIS